MTIGPGGLSSSLQDPTDPGQVVLTALEIDVIAPVGCPRSARRRCQNGDIFGGPATFGMSGCCPGKGGQLETVDEISRSGEVWDRARWM
jgi:hypothetical protein